MGVKEAEPPWRLPRPAEQPMPTFKPATEKANADVGRAPEAVAVPERRTKKQRAKRPAVLSHS